MNTSTNIAMINNQMFDGILVFPYNQVMLSKMTVIARYEAIYSLFV